MNRNRLFSILLFGTPCFILLSTSWIFFLRIPIADEHIYHKGRIVLEEEDNNDVECIPSGIEAFPADFFTQDQRQKGGVIVHLIILSYICAMTALVCDQYFVPSLEVITEKLHLSPDVAGATFMAMGASAPELFSSIAGSFITEGDIGLGTILGSAVFNILGISGIVGLVLWNRALYIRWYPVLRDCIVYGITVSVLTFIIADNIVKWWESMTLLIIFTSYIILMHFNPQMEKATLDAVKHFESYSSCTAMCNRNPEKSSLTKIMDKDDKQIVSSKIKYGSEDFGKVTKNVDGDGNDDCCCLSVWRVIMWIPSLLFRLTVPPVRFFPVTFVMSIAWMGALSYIAVWMVTIIGYTLEIPDAVSGLTLLAAGSSVPDLVATVVIARSGKGNMAISNLLGSNTFDLAFCLGAPWFVKSLVSGNGQLLVYSSAMVYTTLTLLLTLVALLLTFQLTRWKLNWTSGLICIFLYVMCITLACLYEMNVFGPINKPTCS